ncbi:MAG: PEP-CTERM sorting domain-containing protein [Pontiellaceae bacterium]|nr:PEP-CTERM sorting domain-containing protein [Pontiellaceae bacterium]MBN2784819.1 PEP-CTERM sorting domain-containing protein [Pontiellaceae bacterium]
MKKHKTAAWSALIGIGMVSVSQATVVAFDHGASWAGGAAGNAATTAFISNNFQNINMTVGDFSDTGNAGVQSTIEAADVLVIGRTLWSGAYDATDMTYYSSLNIPVVFLTSYVTRSSIMGYEGDLNGGAGVDGNETTITAAGALAMGLAEGTYDLYTSGFDTLGTGDVGGGDILATIGGNHLAVGWSAGTTNAAGIVQSANRLLYNFDANGNTTPDSAAGQLALINAMETYTGMTAIPEPTTIGLLGISSVGGLMLVRSRFRR